MLFNSYAFLLVFLPVVWIGWALLRNAPDHRLAFGWLALASLAFYGYWSLEALVLMASSLLVNFLIGSELHALAHQPVAPARRIRHTLIGGIVFNLTLLGYFKYMNFFVANAGAVTGLDLGSPDIVLPIGISFYTFQQIAWLVDTSRGRSERPNLLKHILFITFFPHLIAGPITHHGEMMPQFEPSRLSRRHRALIANLSIGLSVFALGLAKKVLIADQLSPLVGPGFALADQGGTLTASEAWGAALAYTGQIYFDFSAYSDMAIGLARMFGVRLPVNFNSPYKAVSIQDFWRRWHMTLSRFLRDYLYVPLGGSRNGPLMRTRNLMITMLLGGLWHGANWNFVIWGGLHGLMLAVSHAWSGWRKPWQVGPRTAWIAGIASWYLTFTLVVIAWVPFRAETTSGALGMLWSMAGGNGWGLDATLVRSLAPVPLVGSWLADTGRPDTLQLYDLQALAVIYGAILIACLAPNSQEIMARWLPLKGLERIRRVWWHWRPTPAWGLAVSALLMIGVVAVGEVSSEFLYFQF